MPCAAEHLDVARLGAGRDLDLDLAGRARDGERRAERRLRHRQLDDGVEIGAVALDAGLRYARRPGRRDRRPGLRARPHGPRRGRGSAGRRRCRRERRSRPGDRGACGRSRRRSRTASRRCGRAPSQRGQAPVRTNCPKTLCETCCTRPGAAADVAGDGDRPGAAPLPPHVSHVCATRVGTLTEIPVNASASEISALAATSPPRVGPPRRACCPKSDSPKKAPKMSERLPRSKSAGVKPPPRSPSRP